MTHDPARFLDKEGAKVLVEVASVRGSAPREQGAFMLVSMDAIAGTIGGGQLEYMAIDHARRMLAGKASDATMSVPLDLRSVNAAAVGSRSAFASSMRS